MLRRQASGMSTLQVLPATAQVNPEETLKLMQPELYKQIQMQKQMQYAKKIQRDSDKKPQSSLEAPRGESIKQSTPLEVAPIETK
jgi:hypothetical protein